MNSALQPRPFDSNRAWQDAAHLMKRNRDLLLALAGAFVVLPAFALAILLPPPEMGEGVKPQAFLATLGEYYRDNAPGLLLGALVSLAGTLAMLALFTDASRPTVGQAITIAFKRLPTVIFAQIILGAAVGSMLLVSLILGETLKNPGVSVLGIAAAILLGLWAVVRLSLVAPVVMVESSANPIAAIRRSWQLTEGNALRLLFFYALVFVAFFVLTAIIQGLVGALIALVADLHSAMLVSTLVATILQGAMTVCFTAIAAACYRQLANPHPPSALGSTFS